MGRMRTRAVIAVVVALAVGVPATVATLSEAATPPTGVITAPVRGTGFRARLAAYALLRGADVSQPKIDRALRQFAAALAKVRGDGVVADSAFQDDAEGIVQLSTSSFPRDVARRVAEATVVADRVAAVVQYEMARTRAGALPPATLPPTVANHLSQATRDIARGDGQAAAGAHDQAIRSYRAAWIAATKALENVAAGVDADGDLLATDVETALGLNPAAADTDGDRLVDIEELWTTFTDPRRPSTDGVVNDADADPDGDGLGHFRELRAGSDPLVADTDGDGVPDGREVDVLRTDPSNPDTDADRLADGSEGRLGTNPLDPDSDDDGVLDGDETYTSVATFAGVGLRVDMTGVGDVADAVSVRDGSAEPWLDDLPGLASPVVDLESDRPFTAARLTLPFDPTAVPNGDVAGLRIMWFDEVVGTWRPLPPSATTVDPVARTVSATTDHFTLFAVFYVPTWNAVLQAFDPNPGGGGGGGSSSFVDVALVLDSSGSMISNDPQGFRRTAAKRFIDALIPGDQVAVVDFDASARLLQPLTTDVAAAKRAVDLIDSSGGTDIGAGVRVANTELIGRGDPTHARIQILLTDGEGAYNAALTQQAIDNRITIYTIGLGTGVNAALLTQIATATGGQYFAVATADQLPDVFSRIPINLDPAGDEDRDGIKNGIEITGAITGTGARYILDPRDPDTDGDGLTDGEEIRLGDFSQLYAYYVVTNPRAIDSDDDGLADGEELELGLNPLQSDADRDGLTDGVEVVSGFDPRAANPDNDPFGDRKELEQGSNPYTYDLDGADQARAFVAGALLGEFGPNVPAFDTSLKDLAGDLVGLGPDIPYVSDGLRNIADGVSGALTGIGCGINDVLGFANPFGGGPGDGLCDLLNFRIKYDPAYFTSLSYLGGWIAVSLIPFVDIVASVRDVIGALVNGNWIGAGLEFIFGVIGFFAPAIGDVPGIAGKILKFLAAAPNAVGAVVKFVFKRFGALDEVFLPLVKAVWGVSDDKIARVGGKSGILSLSDEAVDISKLSKFLDNAANRVTREAVDEPGVLSRVARDWDEAAEGAAERQVRNLAAEAVSTEAAVALLERRGYDVLYVSRNTPLDVGTGVKSISNGPDIIARSPSGRPVIVEVKGSNQDVLRLGRSTVTSTAGGQRAVQTSRTWLTNNPDRYLATLREAAAINPNGPLADAVDVMEEILNNGAAYDVVVVAVAKDSRFAGTLEDALTNLDNRGATEVVTVNVSGQTLDSAYQTLSP